ncbi:nuclear pore complex component-domain-containing protein [Pyronema omphalodes]|nr:nuclear pore complex component-domain-containing protein [Pyronema omphalodes]
MFASAPTTPATPTGTWRHPAMEALSQRRSRETFTDASLAKVTWNGFALVMSFILVAFGGTTRLHDKVLLNAPSLLTYGMYLVWFIRLLFLYNIGDMLNKLYNTSTKDYSDIPMTPDQRRLLGLSPGNVRVPAPAQSFENTPPRYTKSSPTARSTSAAPPVSSSPVINRSSTASTASVAEVQSPMQTPLKGLSGGKLGWGSPRTPAAAGASSVTPGNRWAYEKSILSPKGQGARGSPQKQSLNSLFATIASR